MQTKEYLCVSYFDNIIGPNIFYCNEDLTKSSDSPNLGRILEFAEEENTFIFAFKNFQTLNHIFFIETPHARGGKDLFMISYLIRGDSLIDQISDIYYYLHSKKPILRDFAQKLSTLEELTDVVQENKYKSLTRNVKSLGSEEFQKKFQKLFDHSFNNLLMKNDQNVSSSKYEPIKKLFILGGKYVGKTTFLNQVKAIQSNLTKASDLSTKIFEVILDNVEELRAECYEDLLKCDQCDINNRCITQAQGFIIIFNNSKRESISEAKARFNKIYKKFCKYNPDKAIPILLIGNKLQKNDEVKTTTPPNEWNTKKGKGCNIVAKHIEVDLTNGGAMLQKSFQWIIKQLL